MSLLLYIRIDHTGCKIEDIPGSSLGCRGFIVETERGIAEARKSGTAHCSQYRLFLQPFSLVSIMCSPAKGLELFKYDTKY